VNADGVVTDIAAIEFKELVSGYSIVKAESYDEAVEITKTCPIFNHPGCSVEVREIMQMG
ncbi:YCII-related protein, partial [Vibrio nigripulchritudo ATCC 27043]